MSRKFYVLKQKLAVTFSNKFLKSACLLVQYGCIVTNVSISHPTRFIKHFRICSHFDQYLDFIYCAVFLTLRTEIYGYRNSTVIAKSLFDELVSSLWFQSVIIVTDCS